MFYLSEEFCKRPWCFTCSCYAHGVEHIRGQFFHSSNTSVQRYLQKNNQISKRPYYAVLSFKWPSFDPCYQATHIHTHRPGGQIYSSITKGRLFGSFLPLNEETEPHCLLLIVLCVSALRLPRDLPVGPNRYVFVLISACLWNRKEG